mmetsp:Transcript_122784/g.191688  ORF Transcript_122784/g.191688 Transcript_122784/m.191688 type:complete len:508 (-) Transcript_122784:52-1575(-)
MSLTFSLSTLLLVVLGPLAVSTNECSDSQHEPINDAEDTCGFIQRATHVTSVDKNLPQLTSEEHQLPLEPSAKQHWANEVLSALDGSPTNKPCIQDGDCRWHSRCNTHIMKCETMGLGEKIGADIIMCVLAFLIAGFALAAGVGGGGLYVPLLMIVLSFDTRVGTALSQAMLSGGAIAAFLYNCNGSFPGKPQRPLISFELAVVMGTGLMAGAQVGSVLHALAPPALTLVLLLIVLLDSARKSLRLAHNMTAKEAEAEKKVEGKPENTTVVEQVSEDPNAEKILHRSHIAKWCLLGLWLLVLALILVKGVFLPLCTWSWWTVTFAMAAFLGCCSLYFAQWLSSQEKVDEFDIDFQEHAFALSRMSLIAGALAALCGIGGGMVMGPLLVEMKVPPPVSSATTATTLVVLSSSTLLVYIVRGVAPAGYSVFLPLFTMGGALTGKMLVGWWIRKTGKQSLIVWALAAVTILSICLMGMQGLMTIVKNPPAAIAFRNFCAGHIHHTVPKTR